jgi:hypothetical protein
MSVPLKVDTEAVPGGESPPIKMASLPVHNAMASFLGDNGEAGRLDHCPVDGLYAAPPFESTGVLVVFSV